jgi:hypothetical protein
MTSIALATVAEAGRTEPVCPQTVRRELERVRGYQRAVGYASEGSRSLGLYTLLTDVFMAVTQPRLGEGLREVAKRGPALGIRFLGEQAQVVAIR